MQFLPIVDRELRVASRHAETWWRRVSTTGVALLLLVFVLVAVAESQGSRAVGRELFSSLSALGLIYAVLAGPLSTTDCLSRERREGTLGLLFLTDLRSYDVVLGKMAVASLDILLDLLAALPIAAIPILLGGVTLPQLAIVALTLFNTAFLSLALGTCVSALSRSGRSALIVTLGILFLLTLGLIILGEGVLSISLGSPSNWWFYLLCPVYAMASCMDLRYGYPGWHYWINLLASHLFAWLCVWVAISRTARSWREVPVVGSFSRFETRLQRWRNGSGPAKARRRKAVFASNPITWLDARDRLPERILWVCLLAVAIIGTLLHSHDAQLPDESWLIVLPVLGHYGLLVLLAVEAPRRLAEDRESGALELLLCTPVTPEQIIRGCMKALWRRFGLTFLAMLVVEIYFACLFFDQRGGWARHRDGALTRLFFVGLCTFPLQLYTMARVGLYQGLVSANALRATFTVALKAGLLPWFTWTAGIVGLETLARSFAITSGGKDALLLISWTVIHLMFCFAFLAHASARLHWDFRVLAARTQPLKWWQGLMPLS